MKMSTELLETRGGFR